MSTRVHVIVRGRVQGVGFRDWVRRTAVPLGLTGYARNEPDGSVEIVAEGSREAAEALLRALVGPTPGLVQSSEHDWTDARGETGFRAS